MRLPLIPLVVAAIAAPLSLSFAYSVQPMIYTLTPSGSGSSIRLTVANSREGLLNVELEPYAVTADDTGKRTFTPSPDDFLIFPPQASIAGDKTQLFQVKYVGPASMTTGRVYVLRVHQTNTIEAGPAETADKAQTHLAMSLNFNTTAIVQPRQLTPSITVEREPEPDAKGLLHARLVNRGTGVADLTRIAWGVNRSGKTEPLAIQDIKYGEAVFLEPGHSREITLSDRIKGPVRLVAEQSGDGRGDKRS